MIIKRVQNHYNIDTEVRVQYTVPYAGENKYEETYWTDLPSSQLIEDSREISRVALTNF